jgi:hypothetical protein
MNGRTGKVIQQIFLLVGVLGIWLLLQIVILPRFGFRT